MSAPNDARTVPAGDIARAAAIVRAGGVVAFPTETWYGLGADPFQPSALHALMDIKGRSEDKPIALIAGSREDVERTFGPLTPLARRLAEEFWPGPLTLVLPAPISWPRVLLGAGGGAGVRVPDLESARILAKASGGLLTATSANLSGHPPAATAQDVRAGLQSGLGARRLGMILDGGRTPGGPPSTVLDLSADPPRLARAGPIAPDLLERAVGGPISRLF